MQILSCCSLIMIPIPLVLYLDAAFGLKNKIVVPGICGLSAAEFVICTALHFTGVMDYHETLTFSHIMLAISAALLLYSIVKNAYRAGNSKIRNIYRALRTIGLMVICFATVIDILRYYLGNNGDSAMFVRIGLLIFILCYGSSSLEKMINAVKLGVQSEFVSQLAYRDGLTGIGNRTAFQERLEELEKEKQQLSGIAIIMFDVNDLKLVNDNQGHQKGDELLVCSAEIIKEAVESVKGTCYRIGDDEFVGILCGEDVAGCCEKVVISFSKAMEDYNAVEGQPFRISIASGYTVYDKLRDTLYFLFWNLHFILHYFFPSQKISITFLFLLHFSLHCQESVSGLETDNNFRGNKLCGSMVSQSQRYILHPKKGFQKNAHNV